MAKLEKMQRFVPSLYRPTVNPYVKGLLNAWSVEDDNIVSSVQNAKEQIFVKFAQLQFLDALGSNVGVFRPAAINLSDVQFRDLIPALSWNPKQVKPTIYKVLDVFFGNNNPLVRISELNPNEIVIQIPSSVPALRRDLRGSLHFKDYTGVIDSVDNILKTMTVTMGDTKALVLDELEDADFGQLLKNDTIIGNSAGTVGVTLQFNVSADLSGYQTGENFVIANVTKYVGAFVPNPTKAFTVTKQRGILGQNIVAGSLIPTLIMQDASGIPDAPGRLTFNFGRSGEEADIKYFSRPNNTTLLIDPSYNFLRDHSIGEAVNVIVKPYIDPRIDGFDYSVYLVGVTAARILAQKIVESVTASGVVIRWVVVEPHCD